MNRPVGEPAGFFQQLYPPELVMRNADAIGLKPDQIEAIKKAMPLSSNEAREQQRADAKRLEQLLKNDRVDMTQALAQLDKLLQMENDFKRKQLEALIQVKNLLTPEQRSKLDSIKRGVSSPRSGEEPRFGPREGRTREDGGVH